MAASHEFTADIHWSGDRGEGTRTYRGYDRTWRLETRGGVQLDCSNDPGLGGDPSKPNPEDLLLASLASCHMLWFLHLASTAGIVVRAYADTPLGIGESGPKGEGRFTKAILRPRITLEPGADRSKADALHHEVSRYCFIARSVNFPVEYAATYQEFEGGRDEEG
jgi:organic hydroperoxide reductase OsmC/OhrA